MGGFRILELNDSNKLNQPFLKEGYHELVDHLEKNNELIFIIDGLLNKLENDENFPFLMFEMIDEILPNLIGKKGTKFLDYILEFGYGEFDLTKKIDIDLHILVKKYGILYLCSKKYINNQFDFVTGQFIGTSERDRMMIRLIRSDKSSFIFNLDIKTMTSMIIRLLDFLGRGVTNINEKMTEDDFNRLITAFGKLLHESGYFEEYTEQVDDNDKQS